MADRRNPGALLFASGIRVVRARGAPVFPSARAICSFSSGVARASPSAASSGSTARPSCRAGLRRAVTASTAWRRTIALGSDSISSTAGTVAGSPRSVSALRPEYGSSDPLRMASTIAGPAPVAFIDPRTRAAPAATLALPYCSSAARKSGTARAPLISRASRTGDVFCGGVLPGQCANRALARRAPIRFVRAPR